MRVVVKAKGWILRGGGRVRVQARRRESPFGGNWRTKLHRDLVASFPTIEGATASSEDPQSRWLAQKAATGLPRCWPDPAPVRGAKFTTSAPLLMRPSWGQSERMGAFMNNLTFLQRVHRRIALLGGSFTHPDGSIELDFEAAAGVDHYRDSEEVKAAKVDRKTVKDARSSCVVGAMMVGLGVYLLTRPDASGWQLLGGAALVALGVYQVAN